MSVTVNEAHRAGQTWRRVFGTGLHYIPAARTVFEIGPLSTADCALTVLVALGPVTAIEVSKLVQRWRAR